MRTPRFFAKVPVTGPALGSICKRARAALIDPEESENCTTCERQNPRRATTTYLAVVDKRRGNIASMIQGSNYDYFGSGVGSSGEWVFPLHNRGALFVLDANDPERAGTTQAALYHTIILPRQFILGTKATFISGALGVLVE